MDGQSEACCQVRIGKLEIESAIRSADAFIACLSMKSISKRGFLQKEIRHALNVLGPLPPGQIYLIPLLNRTLLAPSAPAVATLA